MIFLPGRLAVMLVLNLLRVSRFAR